MPHDIRLSGEELKKSYWLLTHVRDIRKRIIVAWIVGIAGIWVFTLLSFANLYLFSYQQNRINLQNMVAQVSSFPRAVQLADPDLLNRGVIPASGETVDLYALLNNTFENWWAEIEYHFELGGVPLAVRKDFILPQTKQYILQLAEHGESGSSVQFVIDRLRWHYVSSHNSRVLIQRNRFASQNISYTPASQTQFARALPISSLHFDFVNDTPYSYWEALLPIVAKSADTIVAASLVKIADIKREEIRPVEVRWFHSFEHPTSFEISPHINVLDPSAYRSR